MSAVQGFVCKCFLAAALFGLTFAGPGSAAAGEVVKFDSAALRPGAAAQEPSRDDAAHIQGVFAKPKGDGPFPAIVLLHSCLGLPTAAGSMVDRLARWGYVALFVDDFATRGIKETCARDFDGAASDAFGALLYLSRLPYVDSRRIAAVGYSQGGDTALQVASGRLASTFAVPRDLNFSAAVAFYPPCANQQNARLQLPTLILIGRSDEVTPAADCERLAKAQSGPGPALKLLIYPGAHHGFDNPQLAAGAKLFGMWMQYNANAAEHSSLAMRDFLAAMLAR